MLKDLLRVPGLILDAFKSAVGKESESSKRDRARDVDDAMIKWKLGRAHFTRKQNHAYRRAKVSALTSDERARARELRWI
jgi:hypothetical protein